MLDYPIHVMSGYMSGNASRGGVRWQHPHKQKPHVIIANALAQKRFEVVGRITDKALLRALAAEIANDSEQAEKLRWELVKAVNPANNRILSVFDRPELRGLDLQVPPRGELSGEWVEL